MKRRILQDLALRQALNLLEPAEAAQLALAAAHDEETREEMAAFVDTIAALTLAALRPVTPPPSLRERIMSRVRQTPQQPAAIPFGSVAALPPAPSGFHFNPFHGGDWMETGIPGIRTKVLSDHPDANFQIVLGELAPGAAFPEHDHFGREELLVISGHLETEGRLLGPGDFLCAEAGTHHHPLTSPDGCIALVIQPRPKAA